MSQSTITNNRHNLEWSDPTAATAIRNLTKTAPLPLAAMASVRDCLISDPNSNPRAIAKSLGLARHLVAAAVDFLVESNAVPSREGGR